MNACMDEYATRYKSLNLTFNYDTLPFKNLPWLPLPTE